MPPQVLAISAPTTEELTRVGIGVAGAGLAGVVEGVIIKMAPQLGALEVPFTWATLLGVPAIGAAGALFTKGMLGDLFAGVAAGGTAIAAYILPAMLIPEGLFGKKAPRGQNPGSEVKLLGAGNAAQNAQAAAARSASVGLTLE